MAKIYQETQSSVEEKVYPLKYNLLTGVTLSDVSFTHTKPDGTTADDITLDGAITSPYANVAVPADLDVGIHYISCVAETDDTKLSPEILLIITVNR